ncbi:hypothetical protein BDV39DRAFT_175364 [Aspergillus sergii]|uniref:AAA+ ATPase domain-containing protein n=1 Tax=Aspergillus sergii TaxID=1034303 RepID=A0A5N6X3W9_9EURO|nr:hypothetical protein BDV39DRAFT_175364 [Aspergillus sergii]
MASLKHDQYTIAWICALPLEMAAACAMLTKAHTPLSKASTDPNAYELGELNGHFIVIACLPAGVYGKVSAATVVSRMRLTFPRLQFGLMVGIGGGVPSNSNDIRLGDVVVSKPVGKYSGVIQYDYGKAVQGGQFEPTGALNKPPQALLTHISRLEAKQMTGSEDDVSKIVSEVLEQNPDIKKRFSPPEHTADLLFRSSYHHGNQGDSCEMCDKEQVVKRQERDTRAPFIHYGLIASGDQVIKDPETRDRLAQRHGILCFEMEAAGLMDDLPTLVIRGICDYCDSHKQKDWQGYAALTAAAYAKSLLSGVPVCPMDVDSPKNNKARHWVVSLARNPRFVGRQDEITKLEELITMQDGPRRVAITGLGGIGKTQVALEVAYRIRDRDKECSVFWVPCTSHGMIEQTFANIAQTLGLHDVKPAEAKEQIKIYLSSERAGKWLLIFDNADDSEMWLTGNDTAPALEDFLPQSDQGHILFTSRNADLAVDLTGSNIISVPDVDKDTALNILKNLLLQKHLLEDHITTVALLEQLAFLPLAIAQASAYINKKRLTLSAYLTLLQEEEDDAVELLSEDFRDPGRYKDIQNPVITTWLISFKQIQHQDQLAADYLSFMACINPRNIPHSLLPPQTSRKQRLDALGLLNAYSFTNSQDLDISMHRLVHIATRNWLRKNGLFSHWIQRVADRMDIVFPNAHYTNRGLWREYLPHALVLVYDDEFIVQQEQYSILVEKVADCLNSDGKYHEAEALYKTLIRINQDRDGIQHTTTLISMGKLASTYCSKGQWHEAEMLSIQVMETMKIVLGPEHPSTLASMVNLASTYWHQRRLKEAENLIVQVVETMKIVLGTEHPDTLASMANLASIYRKQGQWSEAEKLIIQVTERSKAVFGEEHPDTLISIGNLALTYRQQERLHEAEALGIQVMERSKAVLGAEHPYTLVSIGNLASTYRQQRRWHEAEKLDIQVMERSKAVLGAEHPNTLTIMANLAYTWKSQGKSQDALSLMEKCLELQNKVLGPSHPHTRSTCYELCNWRDEYSLSLSCTSQEHPLE